MGTSAVTFAGAGVWVPDGLLQIWLARLARRAKSSEPDSGWKMLARSNWGAEATSGIIGCIHAGLDEIASSDDFRRELVDLCRQEITSLKESVRTRLPPSELAELIGEDIVFERGVCVANLVAVGQAFVQLLEGRLPLPASGYSPMVEGLQFSDT